MMGEVSDDILLQWHCVQCHLLGHQDTLTKCIFSQINLFLLLNNFLYEAYSQTSV